MTAKTEDSRPIVGDPSATFFQGNGSAGAAAIVERPHLDMRPEDMFPGDSEPSTAIPNLFGANVPDDGPRERWLFRITNELRPEEVARLFQKPAADMCQKMIEAVDEIFGAEHVKLLGTAIPGVDAPYRAERVRSRIKRLAMRFADRFLDMVPRAELSHARAMHAAQLEARVHRAKIETVMDFTGHLRGKIVELKRHIFPGPTSAIREGKTFRGERTIAVWAGLDEETGEPTQPTHEPDF